MKFASIEIDTPISYADKRDGQLVVISRDESRCALVPRETALTLLDALERWEIVLPQLKLIGEDLERGRWQAVRDLALVVYKAPLPRTYQWLDGSAFIQHIILVRKARGVEPPKNITSDPLMYQGIGDYLDGPNSDIACLDHSHGLDLEGEVGVFLDETPLGVSPQDARSHVKLLALINDVSLRGLIPVELEKGFGFLQSKPSTSFAPFAVTPDELGDAWKDGRVHLDIECSLNGNVIGTPSAAEMHFSFDQLIAHAARTRRLSPGTFIGSGTISNQDRSRGVACLAERRMLEIIDARNAHPDAPELHQPSTPFLKPGDCVEIDMKIGGRSLFGRIKQKVIAAG